jgi:hypothetical protein
MKNMIRMMVVASVAIVATTAQAATNVLSVVTTNAGDLESGFGLLYGLGIVITLGFGLRKLLRRV